MPSYEDKRHRFKNASPTDFAPGAPRFDNPTKLVYKKEPIIPSSTRPRDAFRVSSAPKPLDPEPIPEPANPVERVPNSNDWDL